jgi:hypothetical protein
MAGFLKTPLLTLDTKTQMPYVSITPIDGGSSQGFYWSIGISSRMP